MSRAAEISLPFAGEDRLFRLPLGRIRALQEKTDCGPYELHRRIGLGTWRIDDIRETLFQGMIGGGLEVAKAQKVLETNFDGLPIMQFVPTANAVLMAALSGVEDEPLGEQKAGTT